MVMMKDLGYLVNQARARLEEIPKEALMYRANTMSAIRPIASVGERTFNRDTHLETLLNKTYLERTDKKNATPFEVAL
jgi:hypothetical protein